MSHSISQHFSLNFHSIFFCFIVTVKIIIIIIILIFLGCHSRLQWFFYNCNKISVLVWGLILHIVLQIWVKFQISVLLLFWCFCYNCDSSEDWNKLYNGYCKLLSKNGSGTNKCQILLEALIQILILDIQSLQILFKLFKIT